MSSIKQAAEEMLLQTIIPFWKGLRDEENGGFYGYMDFDLKLDKKAEKGCILNSRILWFFSEAAMLTGRADLAEDARHAYQFFLKNCYDEANGGVYWSCDYTGKPQDTTKHTYNQGFAIYALSAYYRLTKDPVALAYAKKIFHLIEQHCTDSEGYLEAFAQLYTDAALQIHALAAGEAPPPESLALTTVEDGVAGMRFIETSLASHAADGRWLPLS